MSGNLPVGWAWATPTDLASPERYSLSIGPFGSSLKVSDYRDSGVPLIFVRNIRSENFDDNDPKFVSEDKATQLAAHEVHPGDVLITKMGDPPGDSALYPISRPVGVVTADCIRWKIDPDVGDARFIVYATRTPQIREQILDITRGVAQRKVSLARFKSIRYRLAPLNEQHRIVAAIESYLTRLDDAVATLERVQRNLKRYRAAVLKAAVEGRLVPTEAELARAEGRDYEPASVLLERILAERRRRWEEAELAKMKAKGKSPKDDKWKVKYVEPVAPDTSELPDLPEGWCWASMDQLGVVSGGLTQNAKRELLSTQIPFLRVANVYSNELRLDEIKTIGVSAAEVDRVRLVPGDLLIVEGNGSIEQIGRVALWDGSIEPCLHQNHLIKVRFAPVGLGQWSLCWLLAPSGRVAIERAASSTSGLHTLSLSKVQRLPVPLAPLAEQSRVTDEVDRLLTVATAAAGDMSRNAHRASRLRQSILKWAFEGRLVDQDPNDEPASALLDRIRAEREAAPSTRRRAPSSRARGTLTSPCPDQPST